jgi:phosphocarrier protein
MYTGIIDPNSLCIEGAMKTKTFIVKNELGFPSRSAVAIVHLVSNSKSEVWIEKDAERKNGKSIVDVLSLKMPYGSKLTVSVEGEDEHIVMEQISNLIESGL